MNFLEQQRSNRRRTWAVMAAFVGLALFIGAGFDLFIFGSTQGGFVLPVGTAGALALSSASAATSYFAGDRAVLRSTQAIPVDTALAAADPDYRLRLTQLRNVVDEMAIASGLPAPKVFVVPDPDANAFATGRDPAHASIAVTEGLLRTLNREQLQGVVAHEMSHVRNYDIRLMTVIAALVGTLALLSDWAGRVGRVGGGTRRGRRSGGKDGGGAGAMVVLAIWLLLIVLAPLIGRLLAMAVSRQREYLADASAAELTRNPGALADALEAIEGMVGPTKLVRQGSAHLCIADPLGLRIDNREGRFADWMATHPPMRRRIQLLRRMAFA
ncbi:MAG TPA: M48 family metallopeptidase [Vicinamibacterales bacterium]|nr:M48 family metallopeptidase [Vicinamibacterales bacterium]